MSKIHCARDAHAIAAVLEALEQLDRATDRNETWVDPEGLEIPLEAADGYTIGHAAYEDDHWRFTPLDPVPDLAEGPEGHDPTDDLRRALASREKELKREMERNLSLAYHLDRAIRKLHEDGDGRGHDSGPYRDCSTIRCSDAVRAMDAAMQPHASVRPPDPPPPPPGRKVG